MNLFKNIRRKIFDARSFDKKVPVNEYITMVLNKKKSYIYVNGKKFQQCIRLIINIPKQDAYQYDEVETVDDARKIYNRSLYQNQTIPETKEANIDHEEEFWGHCSNIQTWVELNYNHRVIAANLAYPLLRKLSELGDETAREAFKEAIMYRIRKGNAGVIQYIKEEEIDLFSHDELEQMLSSVEDYVHPHEADIAWNGIGRSWYKEEEYDKSILAFKSAIHVNPLRVTAWQGLSSAYYRKEEYENALDALLHAVELDEDCYESWIMLSMTYKKLDNIPEAKRAFRTARRISHRHDPPAEFMRWLSTGNFMMG